MEKRAALDYTDVTAIRSLKRGRPLTLGDIGGEVQLYIRALHAAGTPVNIAIVIVSAKGIVMTKNQTVLAENGGHICLTASWAKQKLCKQWFQKGGIINATKDTNMTQCDTESVPATEDEDPFGSDCD